MKGNSFNKILSFFEISLSLISFIIIFYIMTSFYSDLIFKKILDRNRYNIEPNKDKIAAIINARDSSFYDNDGEFEIAFVGDIMLDRGVEQKVNKEGNGDFNFVFSNIKNRLSNYDFLVGNLEGPVSDKGIDKNNLYSFRMKPEVLDILKEVGFSALTVTNNHMGDWGIDAMEDTFKRLNEKGIGVIGGGENKEESIQPKILEKEDTKIALLSFSQFGRGDFEATDDKPGVAIISEENLKESIDLAKKDADIIIVNFHFGEEYQDKQNSYQEKYAKMAIDFGADLVVGTHPHVIQPLEQYRNSYIAYSLGNFVFDQYFSEKTMEGGLLEVTIKNKRIEKVVLNKIKINNKFQPVL